MAGKAGRSGRKPKTIAQKKADGTFKPKDMKPVAEEWKKKLPPAMRLWSSEVVAEHRRLGQLLIEAGALTEGDWLAWRAGMTAYHWWLYYSDELESLPNHTCFSEKGGRYQDPIVSLHRQSWKDVLAWCGEFGLTPRARGAVVSFVVDEKSTMGGMLDEEDD